MIRRPVSSSLLAHPIALVALVAVLGLGCAPVLDTEVCEPEPIAEAAPIGEDAAQDPVLAAFVRGLTIAAYPTEARQSTRLLIVDPAGPDADALRWDDQGRVLVSTWTRSKYFSGPEYQPGYGFGLYGETWFTTGDQVQAACRDYGEGEGLVLRLEQLLGLPPAMGYDVFMQVWIEPATLFRPCSDPSVTTVGCAITGPLKADGPDASGWSCAAPPDAHGQWLCNAWVDRYGQSDPHRRFPWTALGYTFDWGPDSPDGEGPSEFVAPTGTPVVFERVVATETFCAELR